MLNQSTLQSIAFDMFRLWTIVAGYDWPKLTFEIADERLLVQDLTDSLRKARKSLVEENAEKRAIPGYDVGFVQGFVQSSLNAHWVTEYILKQDPRYREFLALKTLRDYLNFDTLTAIRLESLYKVLTEKDINLQQPPTKVPLRMHKQLVPILEDEVENRKNPVLQTIDNLINDYIYRVIASDTPQYLASAVQHYLTQEVILDWIATPDNDC